ncbi:MAG: LamG-like jellyroll fold domain-containing protein [Humibacter sp.]
MRNRPSMLAVVSRLSVAALAAGLLTVGVTSTGLTAVPAHAEDTSTLDSGLTFNGSNQYVQFDKPLPQSPETIELWLKVPNVGDKREIVYSNYSDPNGISIEIYPNGQLRYYERLGAIDFVTNIDIRDNTWKHVVLERDIPDGKVIFYVNGVEIGEKAATFPASPVIGTQPHFLGQDYRASMRFQGEIGEVRDWSTLRTPTELDATSTTELTGNEPGLIADWGLDDAFATGPDDNVVHDRGPNHINGTLYGFTAPKPTPYILDVDFAGGAPVDHAQGLPITTYGAPTIAQDAGVDGDVATFNGTTDAYSIPLQNQWPRMTNALTTECAFRLNAPTSGSDYLCSGANGGGIDMWVSGTTLTYGLYVGGAYRRATAPIALNHWYDAVMVWDGATVTLYLNGKEASQVPAVGTVGLPSPASAENLILGGDASATTFENPSASSIYRARIFSKALTAAQVADLFDLPARLLAHTLTTPATAVGSAVQQPLGGLWAGAGVPVFTKVDGASWLQVSADGLITGTPGKKDQGTIGTITVQASDGLNTQTIAVEVPVLGSGKRVQLTTASWNLWNNGSHVKDGLAKELTAITDAGLELVGVQESEGTGAKQLADALGWYSYQSGGDLGLLSAYPISSVTEPTAASPAVGVTVTVNGVPVRVWVAHLDEGASDATRSAQAQAIAAEIKPDLAGAKTTPVVLLGDLATSAANITGMFTSAGLTDTGAGTAPTYSLVAAGGATDRVE